MQKTDISKLNSKDKMLIAKALTDIATTIYKDNTDFILNQILKSGNYDSDYGKFFTQTNKAKTIQEVINDDKAKIEKLQEEINELEKLPFKEAIHKEETTILKSKHSTLADNIATEILKDIIADFDSKRLMKSASKVAKTK